MASRATGHSLVSTVSFISTRWTSTTCSTWRQKTVCVTARFDLSEEQRRHSASRSAHLHPGAKMNIFVRQGAACLLIVVLGALPIASAQAQSITCSASMSALTFASVDPLSSQTDATATLTYSCTNSANATRAATLCFSIGEPGGAQTNPRLHVGWHGSTMQFPNLSGLQHGRSSGAAVCFKPS